MVILQSLDIVLLLARNCRIITCHYLSIGAKNYHENFSLSVFNFFYPAIPIHANILIISTLQLFLPYLFRYIFLFYCVLRKAQLSYDNMWDIWLLNGFAFLKSQGPSKHLFNKVTKNYCIFVIFTGKSIK